MANKASLPTMQALKPPLTAAQAQARFDRVRAQQLAAQDAYRRADLVARGWAAPAAGTSRDC